ncbi:MAG: cysteine synthase family protein [Nitrososphaerota archaeon]|nr:cysteine synthase family protein [Nitrososphaerota archaeon]
MSKNVFKSSVELIGNTPLLRLRKVTEGLDAKVFVKTEYLNPSGSIKDRIAYKIIRDAEKQGRLKPGVSTIVEASTGNTGIALSYVGKMLGYRVRIYIPQGVSPERTRIIQRYGAEVEVIGEEEERRLKEKSISGGVVEIPGRLKCAEVEKTEPNTFWARQFSNPSNPLAQSQTGSEILEALDEKVSGFTASIGTGGTLLGIGRKLRRSNPRVRIVAVEPASTKLPLLKEYQKLGRIVRTEVSGGIISDIIEAGLVDEILQVTDEEAITMAHRLVSEEGLFCGISSGANVLAALRLAKKLGRGNVVTVLPDSMDRYLSEEHYTT